MTNPVTMPEEDDGALCPACVGMAATTETQWANRQHNPEWGSPYRVETCPCPECGSAAWATTRQMIAEPRMSAALWLIRILRWIPKTYAYDKHLTDCAALEVIYRPFNGAEPLEIAHVLKLKPLPDFHPEMTRAREAELRRSEFRTLQ